jgi:hypothetical protein
VFLWSFNDDTNQFNHEHRRAMTTDTEFQEVHLPRERWGIVSALATLPRKKQAFRDDWLPTLGSLEDADDRLLFDDDDSNDDEDSKK